MKVEGLVKSKTGSALEDYLNESQEVIDNLQAKLIGEILKEGKSDNASTSLRSQVNPPSGPAPASRYDNPPWRDSDPLRDIGRGDLDPFGRGGGMIFNPPMGPGIPRPDFPPGRVPPGARFDPIYPHPFNPNRSGPNPDHMRPPEGYDDMFM